MHFLVEFEKFWFYLPNYFPWLFIWVLILVYPICGVVIDNQKLEKRYIKVRNHLFWGLWKVKKLKIIRFRRFLWFLKVHNLEEHLLNPVKLYIFWKLSHRTIQKGQNKAFKHDEIDEIISKKLKIGKIQAMESPWPTNSEFLKLFSLKMFYISLLNIIDSIDNGVIF